MPYHIATIASVSARPNPNQVMVVLLIHVMDHVVVLVPVVIIVPPYVILVPVLHVPLPND